MSNEENTTKGESILEQNAANVTKLDKQAADFAAQIRKTVADALIKRHKLNEVAYKNGKVELWFSVNELVSYTKLGYEEAKEYLEYLERYGLAERKSMNDKWKYQIHLAPEKREELLSKRIEELQGFASNIQQQLVFTAGLVYNLKREKKEEEPVVIASQREVESEKEGTEGEATEDKQKP